MDKCRITSLLEKDCHDKKYKYQKQGCLVLIENLNEDRQILEVRIVAECNVDTVLKIIAFLISTNS